MTILRFPEPSQAVSSGANWLQVWGARGRLLLGQAAQRIGLAGVVRDVIVTDDATDVDDFASIHTPGTLWRRFLAWLAYFVPSDEQLECDTPELRSFINRQEALRASRRQESHG